MLKTEQFDLFFNGIVIKEISNAAEKGEMAQCCKSLFSS